MSAWNETIQSDAFKALGASKRNEIQPFTALLALAAPIHQGNIDAGWWKREHAVDRPAHWITIPRNIGELLCLIHSEISEANIGWAEGLQDDKLPHRPMVEVEFADTAIRALDVLGYYMSIDTSEHAFMSYATVCPALINPMLPANMSYMNFGDAWLLCMHRTVSAAMEGFRKGNTEIGCNRLLDLLYILHACSETFGMDLMGSIAEKRAFNATRADHQLENRAKADGKKF